MNTESKMLVYDVKKELEIIYSKVESINTYGKHFAQYKCSTTKLDKSDETEVNFVTIISLDGKTVDKVLASKEQSIAREKQSYCIYYAIQIGIALVDDKTYIAIYKGKNKKIIELDSKMTSFAGAGISLYLIERDKEHGEEARFIEITEDGQILHDMTVIDWGTWQEVFAPSATGWVQPAGTDKLGKPNDRIIVYPDGRTEKLIFVQSRRAAFEAKVRRHMASGCD